MRRPASSQEPGDHDPAAQQQEHHEVPFRSREPTSQSTSYTIADNRQNECLHPEDKASPTVYGKYDASDESALPHIRQLSPEQQNTEIVTTLPDDLSCVPRHYADQQWFDPMRGTLLPWRQYLKLGAIFRALAQVARAESDAGQATCAVEPSAKVPRNMQLQGLLTDST